MPFQQQCACEKADVVELSDMTVTVTEDGLLKPQSRERFPK